MRLVLALIAIAGCTTSEPFEPSPPVEPPGPPEPAWFVAPAGSYHLTTSIELDPEALAGEPTATLKSLAAHPGATLIALADAAHDPALAVLRADLSPGDQAALAGWIDAAVSPLGVLSILGIEYGVAQTMTSFDVESELVFTNGIARHRLVAIDFPAYQQRFALGAEPGELLEAMPATTTDGWGLEIGTHELAMGVGAYAWDAVNAQSGEAGGIRGALGTATMCDYVALEVALHVGHVTEVSQLCERGLDRVVAMGRAEAAMVKFAELHVDRGDVGMDDKDKDHVADADGLWGGVWTARAAAVAGGTTTELTATFE